MTSVLRDAEQDAFRARFIAAFIAVLLATFTPFKILGYCMPILFTAALLPVCSTEARNRLVTCALVAVVVGAFYLAVAPEFLIGNYLLFCLTHATLLPLLVVDTRPLASKDVLEGVLRPVSLMILIQGSFGIAQAVVGAMQRGSFGGSNGDRVTGTMFPHFYPERAFSNPMFVVNLTMMLLACLYTNKTLTASRIKTMLVGTLALVMASVVHALIFLIAAGVLAWVLIRLGRFSAGQRGAARKLALVLVAVVVFSFATQRDNVDLIGKYTETALDLDAVEIPRAMLLARVLFDLPADAPAQPFVGLGPGQFSSRASLIASGLYLGGPDSPKSVPFMTPQTTRLANDYCFDVYLSYALREIPADESSPIGSTQQPFFSFLTIYTELGFVGLCGVIWALSRLLLRIRARVGERPDLEQPAMVLATGIIFLGLLGVQECYWEVSQAILVGCLLLKVQYANLMYDEPAALMSDGAAP